MNKQTPTRSAADGRQNGFTLVELLVVVAIVAILSAIAMHQFIVYKKKAVDTEMINDLKNARTAMENFYEQNDYTYVGATVPILIARHGFQLTDGVTVTLLSLLDSSFSVRSCAPSGNYLSFRYDSDTGAIVGENVAC